MQLTLRNIGKLIVMISVMSVSLSCENPRLGQTPRHPNFKSLKKVSKNDFIVCQAGVFAISGQVGNADVMWFSSDLWKDV
eukprot:624601-Amphidinium_carterae.1